MIPAPMWARQPRVRGIKWPLLTSAFEVQMPEMFKVLTRSEALSLFFQALPSGTETELVDSADALGRVLYDSPWLPYLSRLSRGAPSTGMRCGRPRLSAAANPCRPFSELPVRYRWAEIRD